MKFYIKLLIKTLAVITLFCLQLCFVCFQQSPAINPLLIAYTYALFTTTPLFMLASMMFFLDALTFISTSMVGLTCMFLAPVSWFLIKTRNDLYNKSLAPCILIIAYQIFYGIMLYLFLQYPLHPFSIIWTCFANCFLFITLWRFTNQPFHD
ncbi:MAG: hypothetical protein NTU89_00475 [Candidatus Dependentiae bacterium]|nr:hypothetical protein [Candidatus Dependentiae bacterium]